MPRCVLAKKRLTGLLELTAMPKKGGLSKKDKEFEYSEEFVEAKKRHSAVESAITSETIEPGYLSD